MERKMEVVEDFIVENEIDDISYIGNLEKVEEYDPFDSVKISTLSPKMKRKAKQGNLPKSGTDH